MRAPAFVPCLIAAVASACGPAAARTAADARAEVVRIGVVEPEFETEVATTPTQLADALVRGLEAREAAVDAEVTPLPPDAEHDCAKRASCLRAFGGERGRDFVLASSVAGLGDTALVRVRLVDVRSGDAELIRQLVVSPADAAHLAEAFSVLGAQLAEPWLPVAVGDATRRRRVRIAVPVVVGGVAAAALGVGLAMRPRPSGPDLVIVPP